jgi:hypothetical protein
MIIRLKIQLINRIWTCKIYSVHGFEMHIILIYYDGFDIHYMLSGGNVPYDGSPVDAVDHTHVALTVIYCLLGILGLVFAVACLIFNSLFKNKR